MGKQSKGGNESICLVIFVYVGQCHDIRVEFIPQTNGQESVTKLEDLDLTTNISKGPKIPPPRVTNLLWDWNSFCSWIGSTVDLHTYKGAGTKQFRNPQVSKKGAKSMRMEMMESQRLTSLILSLSKSISELESSKLFTLITVVI